jgi:hypothetical protein
MDIVSDHTILIIPETAGWCQRIKSEFKFEYNYLEDELSSLNPAAGAGIGGGLQGAVPGSQQIAPSH